jgi:hypothetical protein
MDPINNPYSPGAGSRPPALTGRDKELDSFRVLIGRLKAGRSTKGLMITGLRGVGKTVLLTTFRDIAESDKFQTGLSEITHETDFKNLMARFARRIVLSLKPVEKLKDAVWRAAGVLKAFSFKMPDGSELGIDVDVVRGRGDSGYLSDDLGDLFVALGEAAKERKTGVVVLLDEIQFLKNADLEALIAATHRVSQRNLPLTVVGAGLPQLPRLAGEAKSYAERLFDFPKIDRLDPESAREALERPARDQKATYAPQATSAILEFTECYPYFLQEYGKHVWNVAKGPAITKVDVEVARQRVITQLDENFFRVRVDRTTPAEKNYVVAMARLGKGPYKTGDVSAKLKRLTTTVAPLRGILINKGIIYSPSHGLTDFTVPQFDDFLRRNFPL